MVMYCNSVVQCQKLSATIWQYPSDMLWQLKIPSIYSSSNAVLLPNVAGPHGNLWCVNSGNVLMAIWQLASSPLHCPEAAAAASLDVAPSLGELCSRRKEGVISPY